MTANVSKWSLETKVSLGFLVQLIVYVVSIVWFSATMSGTVSQVVHEQQKQAQEQARTADQVEDLRIRTAVLEAWQRTQPPKAATPANPIAEQ